MEIELSFFCKEQLFVFLSRGILHIDDKNIIIINYLQLIEATLFLLLWHGDLQTDDDDEE